MILWINYIVWRRFIHWFTGSFFLQLHLGYTVVRDCTREMCVQLKLLTVPESNNCLHHDTRFCKTYKTTCTFLAHYCCNLCKVLFGYSHKSLKYIVLFDTLFGRFTRLCLTFWWEDDDQIVNTSDPKSYDVRSGITWIIWLELLSQHFYNNRTLWR